MRLLASLSIVSRLTAVAYLVYACTVSAAKRTAAGLCRAVAATYPVLILLLGLALVALGAALVYRPAGLIVAGVGLIVVAVDLMRPPTSGLGGPR